MTMGQLIWFCLMSSYGVKEIFHDIMYLKLNINDIYSTEFDVKLRYFNANQISLIPELDVKQKQII